MIVLYSLIFLVLILVLFMTFLPNYADGKVWIFVADMILIYIAIMSISRSTLGGVLFGLFLILIVIIDFLPSTYSIHVTLASVIEYIGENTHIRNNNLLQSR